MKTTEAPLVTICKAFVEAGRSFMSKNELTGMIFDYVQPDRRPNESPHQTFTRRYTANTDEGLLFRKGVAACPSVSPRPFGGDDGYDAALAYRQLEVLGEQERARLPHLTPEQAFARVATDPANAALAKRAIPVPAPTTSFPFPR